MLKPQAALNRCCARRRPAIHVLRESSGAYRRSRTPGFRQPGFSRPRPCVARNDPRRIRVQATRSNPRKPPADRPGYTSLAVAATCPATEVIDPACYWRAMPKTQRVAPCGVSTGVRSPLAQKITFFAQASNVDLTAGAEEAGQVGTVLSHYTLQEVASRRLPPSASRGILDSFLSDLEPIVDFCRIVEETGVAGPEHLSSRESPGVHRRPCSAKAHQGRVRHIGLHASRSPCDSGVSRFAIRIFHPVRLVAHGAHRTARQGRRRRARPRGGSSCRQRAECRCGLRLR